MRIILLAILTPFFVALIVVLAVAIREDDANGIDDGSQYDQAWDFVEWWICLSEEPEQ